jgi:hypothetical protein
MLFFLRSMMTNCASDSRSDNCVMSSHVAENAASSSA